MISRIEQAAATLEEKGQLRRRKKNQSAWVIEFVSKLIGRSIPTDMADFYRANIDRIGDFTSNIPVWNDYVSRVTDDASIEILLPAKAIPLFWDGCGSLFGVDISEITDHPAVYFFDHADCFECPNFAVGSSIEKALLLLAENDIAIEERRPDRWELAIDPDLDKCPRAPPIWLAD